MCVLHLQHISVGTGHVAWAQQLPCWTVGAALGLRLMWYSPLAFLHLCDHTLSVEDGHGARNPGCSFVYGLLL